MIPVGTSHGLGPHESRLLILNVDSNEIEQLPSNFGQLLGVH